MTEAAVTKHFSSATLPEEPKLAAVLPIDTIAEIFSYSFPLSSLTTSNIATIRIWRELKNIDGVQ